MNKVKWSWFLSAFIQCSFDLFFCFIFFFFSSISSTGSPGESSDDACSTEKCLFLWLADSGSFTKGHVTIVYFKPHAGTSRKIWQCASTGAIENAESSSWCSRAQSFCDAKLSWNLWLYLKQHDMKIDFVLIESFLWVILENNHLFSCVAAERGQKKKSSVSY